MTKAGNIFILYIVININLLKSLSHFSIAPEKANILAYNIRTRAYNCPSSLTRSMSIVSHDKSVADKAKDKKNIVLCGKIAIPFAT